MRICPKCGDYYADGSLAFCLADGTPLVGVDPGSQNWSEGARVIAEKANALSKQKRRLKWRRVSLGTMMILTVVAFLLAAAQNRFYLEPPPPPPATPTPTPSPSPTPTPALFKINGRVTDQDKPLSGVRIMLSGTKPGSTTTDANGNYTFIDLPAGGSYTITPQPSATMSFKPPSRPINKQTMDESEVDFDRVPRDPTPTPTPNECSGDNQEAERKIIIPKVSALLRPEFIAAQGPKGPRDVDGILREIKYEVVFSKTCQNAVVTPSLQIPGLAIPKLRDFKCRKTRDEWSCH